MSYSIKELAELAGITPRALRWYDSLGLLCPKRAENGYRSYGEREIDRLQLILLYRELDMPLDKIGKLLDASDGGGDSGDIVDSLSAHLASLESKRKRLDRLIDTTKKTIASKTGGTEMSDAEKFAAFKKDALEQNESRFGKEAREKYGDSAVDAGNTKFSALTPEQYAELEAVTAQLHEALKAAVEAGDPTSDLAHTVAQLHKKWLCYYWPDYSPEKHKGVTQMYLDDPRFSAYYEEIASGAAKFLRDAVWAWLDCQED